MQKTITLNTDKRERLYDITQEIRDFVDKSSVSSGLLSVYAQGATSAIMIQENWDDSVQEDVIDYLAQEFPKGAWKHDKQDGNGDAHLKAGIVGPGEIIPIIDGQLGLSQWQNVFFCEFDGPRQGRKVVLTILGSKK